MRSALVAAAMLVSLVTARFDALGGEPHGPQFGNNRFSAEILTAAGEPDVDDYVAALAAGERLTIDVAAGPKSGLHPAVALLDPDGAVADAEPRESGRGRRVGVKSFTVTKSGTWTVRVAGRDATEGAYSIRFGVKPSTAPRRAKLHLGGADPLVASREFDAVGGSVLSLAIKSRGKAVPVTLRGVTGPDGTAVFVPASKLVVKPGLVSLRDLTLAATGTYRLDVGIDAGESSASLSFDAVPPARPTGTSTLASPEPSIEVRGKPLDGAAGAVLRIRGSGFSVSSSRARVFVGDVQAMVTEIGAAGTYIDVTAPDAPDGSVVDVTVQNPDGQAATRAGWFRYLAVGPLDVAAIEPARVKVVPGAVQQFTLRLTRPATPPGIDVTLAVTGGLGTVAPLVHVPANATSATFLVTSGAALTTGEVRATYLATVSSDVGVVPPGTVVDLSPTDVTLMGGTTRTMTLTLSSAAPSAGTDVTLSVIGPIGTVPASVHVAAGATSATFSIGTAVNTDVVTGTVRASQDASTFVEAALRIMPPTMVELSGWTVVQRDVYPQVTTRTFTIPAGTLLREGETIVIGRQADHGAFVTYWYGMFFPMVTPFESTARYFDSGGALPILDGWETYELRDENGTLVDGPSIQTVTGLRYLRTPRVPAGELAAWQVVPTAATTYLPGSGSIHSTPSAGVYISKFSDAVLVNGTVDGRYQFLEIYFDRR